MTIFLIIVLIVLVAADLNATTKLTKILTPKDNVHLIKQDTIYEHIETGNQVVVERILKNENKQVRAFICKVLVDLDPVIDSQGESQRIDASQFVDEYMLAEFQPDTPATPLN